MDLADELEDNLPGGDRQDEQAVIICLQFPAGKFNDKNAVDAIFDLDDILRNIVETSSLGSYDGHEFCEREDKETVTFFIYGPDANLLYKEVSPIIQSLSNIQNVSILKRYSQLDDYLNS